LEALQTQLGHRFKDITLLKRALQHRSCGAENNERMEFLGDAVLNYITAEMIFTMFPTLSEGNMSRVRAGLVRQDTLVKVAERIGVKQHLQFNPTDRTCSVNPSMLADALEAIFAAVYMDAGHEVAKKVIRHHMMTLFEKGEAILKKDPKTSLQELLQGRGIALPTYSITGENQDPERRYEVSCQIPAMKIRTVGTGPTRKQAEAVAASNAIKACAR
jgi:ribonuclease-3